MNVFVLEASQGEYYEECYDWVVGVFDSLDLLVEVSEQMALDHPNQEEGVVLTVSKYGINKIDKVCFTTEELGKLFPNESGFDLTQSVVSFKEIFKIECYWNDEARFAEFLEESPFLKDVENVDIVFETGEVLAINGAAVADLKIGEVIDGVISEFKLRIKHDQLDVMNAGKFLHFSADYRGYPESRLTLFDDISCLKIYYSDGTCQQFEVDWDKKVDSFGLQKDDFKDDFGNTCYYLKRKEY